MVQCNRCHKQYIGETKRRLKDRFNENRRPVDKQTNSSKPTTVPEHFLSNDHNASDMLLIPLELIKSNRDGVREAREAYLIDRGQTLEPLKGGVHGSAHVHESKYFFAFARYEPSLFNLIRCSWTIRKGIGNSCVIFFHIIALFRMQITVNTSTVE